MPRRSFSARRSSADLYLKKCATAASRVRDVGIFGLRGATEQGQAAATASDVTSAGTSTAGAGSLSRKKATKNASTAPAQTAGTSQNQNQLTPAASRLASRTCAPTELPS